ncbi:UNVERIFIED_CONTAM: hypothetical protein NCL1_33238 [Trichonephila clavipes]
MSDNKQRCAIKFCLRLVHNATETFTELQQSYGDKGRESVEDESRSGKHSVSKTAENVVRVRDLVRSDRRLSTNYKQDVPHVPL